MVLVVGFYGAGLNAVHLHGELVEEGVHIGDEIRVHAHQGEIAIGNIASKPCSMASILVQDASPSAEAARVSEGRIETSGVP